MSIFERGFGAIFLKAVIRPLLSGPRALALAAAVGAVAAAGSAGAATLDFTDRGQWNGSSGGATSSVDYGWFTAAIATDPVQSATFTENFDGPQSSSYCQANGGPLACQSDGLGIVDDEISAGQSVTVTFSRALQVVGLHFLDLFTSSRGTEEAWLTLNGNDSVIHTFLGTETLRASSGIAGDTRPGRLPLRRGDFRGVTSMTFFGPSIVGDNGDNDYALAGIQVAPIPLPAAGWLLLGALGALGGVAAKRRRKTDA